MQKVKATDYNTIRADVLQHDITDNASLIDSYIKLGVLKNCSRAELKTIMAALENVKTMLYGKV